MRIHGSVGVLFAGLLMSLLLATFASATQPKEVPPGPVPTQISAAKKVFIGYAGENQAIEEESIFSGGSQRAYDEFYAGMKSFGKYELVGAPADADLLFEIELTTPRANPGVSQPNFFGTAPCDPQFRLAIRDPKSNALLWTFIEHVQWAILQGNRDKNFDLALTRLQNDWQGLIARSAAAPDPKP